MGKPAVQLPKKSWFVLSYCSIPEEIAQENSSLNQASCDVYVEYTVTPKKEQANFDDNFDLDNWIIKKYPYAEGEKILIHVDY